MSEPSRWDHALPTTPADVIALLARRVEIHRVWAAWISKGSDDARASAAAGVGTTESHERYARQYEAAIEVIKRCC